MKKALDTVDHKIFRYKCANYGLWGPVLTILLDYFFNKTQLVIAAAKKSNLQKIDTGVPQGSELGPILFLIYLIELPDEFSEIQIILFADDTSVLQNYKPGTGILVANESLNKIRNWTEEHKLTIYMSKHT